MKPTPKSQAQQWAEDAAHRAIYHYLCLALPHNATRPWHTPNGAFMAPTTAARMKRLGMQAGVADLIFTFAGKSYALEVKAPKGRLSRDQELWRDEFVAAGGIYGVVRSIDDARCYLRAWGVPTREVVA